MFGRRESWPDTCHRKQMQYFSDLDIERMTYGFKHAPLSKLTDEQLQASLRCDVPEVGPQPRKVLGIESARIFGTICCQDIKPLNENNDL